MPGNALYLSRSSFYLPEELPEMRRAKNLVESKRSVAWSEVVNGGPLPPNPYPGYRPHDSFDERGYLRPSAHDTSDQQERVSGPMSPEDRADRDRQIAKMEAERRRNEVRKKGKREEVLSSLCI